MVLQGVSEWFDDYLRQEAHATNADEDSECSPEMHKTMLLVLARTYDYALKVSFVYCLFSSPLPFVLNSSSRYFSMRVVNFTVGF